LRVVCPTAPVAPTIAIRCAAAISSIVFARMPGVNESCAQQCLRQRPEGWQAGQWPRRRCRLRLKRHLGIEPRKRALGGVCHDWWQGGHRSPCQRQSYLTVFEIL
jgi:hypothetical protein